jgi:regulator of replication initiation timing
VQEITDKLDGLNAAEEKSNILSRIGSQIGKGVQSLTLRASLTKQQELLQKVYAVAGEHFTLAANPTDNAALAAFAAETEEARATLAALTTELINLQAERGRLTDALNKEGSSGKQIQALEKRIVQTQDNLRELYRKAGKETADAAFTAAASMDESSRDTLGKDLNDADLAMLDQIALCREKIAQAEHEITRLKAAIVIDEEKAAIEKHNRGIEEQRKRIAASEAEIADLESRITQANAHIKELSALL